MSKSVWAFRLGDAGFHHRLTDSPLQNRLVQMMAAFFTSDPDLLKKKGEVGD
jgi:hypothetical protein